MSIASAADAADDSPSQHGAKARASFEVSGYSDTDAVRVASPTVAWTVSDELAGWSLNGRYLLDAVTAASVDIVSSASGRWEELRHVGALGGDLKRGDWRTGISTAISSEPDYLSLGGGVTVTVDLLDKTFTPFAGYSLGRDIAGRTGLPLPYWNTLLTQSGQAGATIVVNRSTIASVSVDTVFERGYLAKPYRYVPLFAPGTQDAVPAGSSVALVNQLRLDERPLDQVPDARDRFALTGRMAHRLERVTMRLDERLYRDSWGLSASTTDARVMVDLGRNVIVWPHARFHRQGEVSFWQRAYTAERGAGGTLDIPNFRTGDRELGALYTITVGAGVRWLIGDQAAPWTLLANFDWGSTHYKDALYISSRQAIFGTIGFERGFE